MHRWAVLVISMIIGTALWAPAAPATVVTGVSDQHASTLTAGLFRQLDVRHVRLVVPWDAGAGDGSWTAWLRVARDDGLRPLVAFGPSVGSRCPSAPCALPDLAAYRTAVRAFLDAHPEVREIVAWNEPNHQTQPTFRFPEAAAAYFDAAREVCPACTVVAGNLLDDGALPAYLERYDAALRSTPAVWGLHNYYDATYFETSGVDLMLERTTGPLWLTETGGIVSFTPSGGGRLAYDEQRAAASITWLYAMADSRPRLARMYVYHWQGTTENDFDAGLLGYDGLPRPGYDVVARRVGRRPGTPAAPVVGGTPTAVGRPGASTAPGPGTPATGASRGPAVRLAGRGFSLRTGWRLRTGIACLRPNRGAACHGTLWLRVDGRTTRTPFVVRQVANGAVTARIPRSAWRRLRARRGATVAVRICRPNGTCGAVQRLPRATGVRATRPAASAG